MEHLDINNENIWTLVARKRKLKSENSCDDEEKITEPCWFFNNGGCRHKDGTNKTSDECKYLHNYSSNVRRPPHLTIRKPCDKYNLEGDCQWNENCKYSHHNLSPEEWSRYYPGIPYTLKTNVQKRMLLEKKLADIEGRMKVFEYKQDCLVQDIQLLKKSEKAEKLNNAITELI